MYCTNTYQIILPASFISKFLSTSEFGVTGHEFGGLIGKPDCARAGLKKYIQHILQEIYYIPSQGFELGFVLGIELGIEFGIELVIKLCLSLSSNIPKRYIFIGLYHHRHILNQIYCNPNPAVKPNLLLYLMMR